MGDWRLSELPDGRRVEFVDAVPVGRDGDTLICDDGVIHGPIRTRVPLHEDGE